jgi:hypothetical protein
MAEMLGKLAVNVPADFRARLVRVNDEPVGLLDNGSCRLGFGLRRGRALCRGNGSLGLGTGATRPKSEAKNTDRGYDNEGFDVHADNSREVWAGYKESF